MTLNNAPTYHDSLESDWTSARKDDIDAVPLLAEKKHGNVSLFQFKTFVV